MRANIIYSILWIICALRSRSVKYNDQFTSFFMY